MATKDNRTEHKVLQSVQNALEILELLQTQPTVTAAEIGEHLGLGRSTVHRLLSTLERKDFVQRDRVLRSYRAGRTLIAIGVSAVGDIDVRKKARSFMEELAHSTGETVHLFVLEGANTRIVDGVEGTQLVRVAIETGALYPAHATAGGKALLAALPAERLHALFPRGLPKVTPTTKTKWEEFDAEMDATRRRRYAVNHGESDEGVSGVAVPIIDRNRRLIASLALSIPRTRLTDENVPELAEELRRQAGRIGATLI